MLYLILSDFKSILLRNYDIKYNKTPILFFLHLTFNVNQPRRVGATVARPPPERKVGCSNHSLSIFKHFFSNY